MFVATFFFLNFFYFCLSTRFSCSVIVSTIAIPGDRRVIVARMEILCSNRNQNYGEREKKGRSKKKESVRIYVYLFNVYDEDNDRTINHNARKIVGFSVHFIL